MKIAILVALSAISAVAVAKDVAVRPHITKDGTYVAPSHRTSPDSTIRNNYGTSPNVNPYTGQQGKRDPYAIPEPRAPRPAK